MGILIALVGLYIIFAVTMICGLLSRVNKVAATPAPTADKGQA